MKKYNEFINENSAYGEFNKSLPIGFRFSIDFTDATREQFSEFYTEMRKYFTFKNGILTYPASDPKPWSWSFEISVRGDGVELEYWPMTLDKSKIGATSGSNFLERCISIDDFISIGFEGVRNFIKMKNDMNKYNL